MLNKVWGWLKARWEWGKGHCPACHRKFYGAQELYNYGCEVCKGHTNDLTIWSNWRHWKPKKEPLPKVLHSHKATTTWHSAKEAVITKE